CSRFFEDEKSLRVEFVSYPALLRRFAISASPDLSPREEARRRSRRVLARLSRGDALPFFERRPLRTSGPRPFERSICPGTPRNLARTYGHFRIRREFGGPRLGTRGAQRRCMPLPSRDRLCILRFAASFLWADLEVDLAEHAFFLDLARELGVPK